MNIPARRRLARASPRFPRRIPAAGKNGDPLNLDRSLTAKFGAR
jgi:hypothetical protein